MERQETTKSMKSTAKKVSRLVITFLKFWKWCSGGKKKARNS